jgi:hypothetical protein
VSIESLRALQEAAPDNCPHCGAGCSAEKHLCTIWACGTGFSLEPGFQSHVCAGRELEKLRRRTAELSTQNAELSARVAELTAEIAELRGTKLSSLRGTKLSSLVGAIKRPEIDSVSIISAMRDEWDL